MFHLVLLSEKVEADILFLTLGLMGGSCCCWEERLVVEPAEAREEEGDSLRRDMVLKWKFYVASY